MLSRLADNVATGWAAKRSSRPDCSVQHHLDLSRKGGDRRRSRYTPARKADNDVTAGLGVPMPLDRRAGDLSHWPTI
jgi:hypothetical protein